MKVKIISTTNFVGGGKSGKKQRFDDWYNKLKEAGYDGPQNPREMQQWMIATPERKADVVEWMRQNPPVSQTNKGRKAYGAKKWEDYTPDEYVNAFTDDLFEYNNPVPGNKNNKFEDLINSAEFKAKTPEEQQAILTEGNKYSLDNSDPSKNNYKKQALPFQQTIPELAGFASALNTYNYQTPDYTHWEVTPNKLNIQPQLQSIDSSLNAVNATTTGNPQVDYARKVGAFTQGLAAKQQAFGNKQNYDSTQEYEAQKINNLARTQEQNYDVNAMNTIYNEYMPEAKDAASTERIKAISSLSKKYALNEANESKKKLMLDNFYKNVRVGKDGYLEMIDKYNLPEEYYKEDAVVPPTLPTTAMVKPISGFTASPNNKMPFTVANPNAPAPPTYFNNRRPTTLNKPVILNKPGYVKPKGSPMILDDTTPMFVGGGRVRRK